MERKREIDTRGWKGKRSRNGLSDGREYPFGRAHFAPFFVGTGPTRCLGPTNDKREQRSPRILGVTTLEASLELCCLPNAKSLPTFVLLPTGETERERVKPKGAVDGGYESTFANRNKGKRSSKIPRGIK